MSTIDLVPGRDVRTANEWRNSGRAKGHAKGQHHARAWAQEYGQSVIKWRNGRITVFVQNGGGIERLRFS